MARFKAGISCAGVSFATLLVAGGPADAQDAAAAKAPALEEVIVTALRQEETLSRTPAAITAVTSAELDRANVTSAVQLQYLAPSLMVTQSNQGIYLSIRGVSTTDTTSKGEPGIQFNTDGIPVSRAEEQALGFFDLQRVEVLAGPQGTLYGKASTGGAVNVITNAPVQNEEYSAKVTLGNYNTQRLEGVMNVPVTDSLAIRFAAAANSRDGYMTLLGGGGRNNGGDQPGDENNLVARLSALARFGNDASLRLTATGGRIDAVGYGNGAASMNFNSNFEAEGTTTAAWNPIPARVEDDFIKGNGQLDLPVGPVRLTYLGSYSRYRTRNLQSNFFFGDQGSNVNDDFQNGVAADGARLLVRDIYETTYQELRFSNENEGRLEWITGLNYWYEHVVENGHSWQLANSITDPALGSNNLESIYLANGWDPAYQSQFNLLNHTNHKSYSVFAHGVYALTDDWHLTVGLRQGTDKIYRKGSIAPGPFQFGPPGNPWPTPEGGLCVNDSECVGPINNSGESESDKLVWNVGTDYQFTPSQMGYVTIGTGYKPGGFNDRDPSTNGGFAAYDPEDMIAYQLGYKVHSPSGFDFTSSLYYYDYENEQIQSTFNFGPGMNWMLTVGVPTTLYGWENSLKWAVTDNSVIDLEANFERSKYKDFSYVSSKSIPVDFTGDALDRTPQTVLMAGYAYTWQVGDGGQLQLHARTRWSSEYSVTNFDYGVHYKQKAFTRSDADLTYTSASGKLETQVFVTNIENEVQITGVPGAYPAGTQFPDGYSASGWAQVSQPRFWGIRESIKF